MRESDTSRLHEVIRDWARILGETNLMSEPMTLRPTYPVERGVLAVLKWRPCYGSPTPTGCMCNLTAPGATGVSGRVCRSGTERC